MASSNETHSVDSGHFHGDVFMKYMILQIYLKRPRYLEEASKVPGEAEILMLLQTF